MKISAVLVGTLGAVALAAPQGEIATSNTCTNPIVRKEWRALTDLEKTKYILAVKCLMLKPSKLKATYPFSTNRFEDFLSIHQNQTPRVHYNGAFLPWHRAFLQDYENALRNECLLPFGLPYWDASLDYLDLNASPVMSTNLGHGGNGVGDVSSAGNCVVNGPFASTRIKIAQGPVPAAANRCILRYFKNDFSAYWNDPAQFAALMTKTDYATFAVALEGDLLPPNPFLTLGVHQGGHSSVGGDMGDMFTSPSDPLFYVFHNNLDRVWAQWQAANPSARQFDVGNPIKPRGNLNLWPDAPAGNVTLDYTLAPMNLKVGQIMNTKGKGQAYGSGKPNGVLCYQYA
ncbi:Di-copper centre-containing protein [Sporormia fimetaria CBS 119925]|uniref:Di-copper centre-containing protein n=1 Tax=Sporormia fimetaria CBS 119925 TaxID=1340428 RepID=A0A6A6UY51_9PLEO|nr:Di-copper centre-containing protein [Sporormia fimetaria CBS 119925]